MKLSTVAKLTCKSVAVRVLAAATLAGAVLAAAPAAQAQRFAVGVRIGGPAYVVPPPRVVYGYGYGPGFYDHRRFEDFRHHEAFIRHEEWEHSHFDHYGYGRGR